MKVNQLTRTLQQLLVVGGLSFITASLTAGETNVSGASGIALNGYDPVAFFTESKPVNGDPGITAKHNEATYLFSSEQHMKMFSANPEKYAPQCGGYCAYGVAVGAIFPIDINTWQIHKGKLYVNLNSAILEAFNKDLDGNIAKANKNWPGVLMKK